jgi:hypothetical protein
MASTPGAAGASAVDPGAVKAWEAVRATGDIQYAPVPPPPIPKEPEWLKALGEWLKAIFEPLGRALGLSWPVIEYILLGLAALAVALIVWRIVAAVIAARRKARPVDAVPEWAPSAHEAQALLEDADRLAAEGRFDEATHLLLRRSVGHIASARPDWLKPASTAREIAVLPGLPQRAREAFALIAARVERSLFALRPLGADDWLAARGAYAQFALADIGAGSVA